MITNPDSWQPGTKPPPGKLELMPDEIHIWRIALDAPQWARALATLLSPAERQRARRFAFDCDAQRFVRRRIALRRILSRYTGIEAGEQRLLCGPAGKPYLAPSSSEQTIAFNMSRSHELALVAVCKNGSVGVDIEFQRPLNEITAIAAQFFSKREQSALSTLPADQQTPAFFNGWTRKEALLKALGTGLLPALERFEISLRPEAPTRVLSVNGDAAAAARWSLTALKPAAGYTAAVAVESAQSKIVCWEYSVKNDYSHTHCGTRSCP